MTSVKTITTPSATFKSVFQHVRYEHLVAGVTGGVTSTLILHPLDLIKIRFAVNDGRSAVPQYNGLKGAITTIFKQEGVRGLYKGVTPNVWGSGSAWGFYFLFYNSIKTWVQGGNSKTPLGPSMHMLLAAQAGILTLVMTNPVWVVKTRLCLQYNDAQPKSGRCYAGMVDALTTIYRLEGVRGLYRGFLPGMFGVSHGAIQFMTYEEMKNFYNQYKNSPIDAKLSTLEYIAFAATSKLLAASITYPYQVIRARLQDQYHTYKGAVDCIQQTWRFEGYRGFYKGLTPNMTRVVPATVITFLVYENVWRFLADYNRMAVH
ncbi:mitochondrial folate transporter/carrier [Cimex lectularius]|uniref:Solute carrier family 25 member 32 n=1 Tax=Cimex lectularius TaxID=79782 RepID=A0A8I6S880_CIMLE|nr:mitochondrial folate transporter/carrier [Cimex lectularius]